MAYGEADLQHRLPLANAVLHVTLIHAFRKRTIVLLIAAFSALLIFLKLAFHVDRYERLWTDQQLESTYIAVPIADTSPHQPKLRPIGELPVGCLEQYYVSGLPCNDGTRLAPIDFLWTWVNGSDPLFNDAKLKAINAYKLDDPYRPTKNNNPYRMFRDNDELRHSMRSVLDSFRSYTSHFHLITSDFGYAESWPRGRRTDRLGLQPQWLISGTDGETEWRDGNVHLTITHHAHFFEPYNHTIFNSYAIESQFGHLVNLSDIFIYMNDDFYMTSPLTPSTFYTQQYGLVFRMYQDVWVSPNKPTKRTPKGEWRSMGLSNYLLSQRFGKRYRPYLQHEAKAVSFPILQEIELVWPDWIAKTASHVFRETVAGDGDFYSMFVHVHFVIERAREALLWSWAVGRIGGTDDHWGEVEMWKAWITLGGSWNGEGNSEIHVEPGVRDTLHPDRVADNLKESGMEDSARTDYQFSSLDGYAYNPFGGWSSLQKRDAGGENTPRRRRAPTKQQSCTISRNECFGLATSGGTGAAKASEIFMEIAFNKPQCGDCIILALLNESGRLGISAFLPPPDRVSPASKAHPIDEWETIPHLPLVADWHDGEFALQDVMRYASETSVRQWTMRLLQRYRYVISGTVSMFEQLENLQQVRDMLARVDRNTDLALLCINDDVTRDGSEISAYFRDWQERKWPRPAAWEVPTPGNEQ